MIADAALHRHVEALPALPQALWQVLAALRDDGASHGDCAGALAGDPALAARVLRLANSAFYRLPGQVASVGDAVHILGRRTLAALVTTAAVTSRFDPARCAAFGFAAFWRHALGTAIAAQALALETGADDDRAFTAGLLHDIGRLALATGFPDAMAAVLRAAAADDVPAVQVEPAVIGTDHAAIGALVARHWRFPDDVVAAIGRHHAPAGGALPALVHAADALVHALDLNAAPDEAVPALDDAAWQLLALQPAQALRVFERTDSGVAALSSALGLA